MINGDLNKLDCDAVLVPVDEQFYVTSSWTKLVGDHGGRIAGVDFPQGSRVVRYRHCASATREPDVWLGNLATVGESGSWYADGVVEFVERGECRSCADFTPDSATAACRQRRRVWPRRFRTRQGRAVQGHRASAQEGRADERRRRGPGLLGRQVLLGGATRATAVARSHDGVEQPIVGFPRDECADELSRQARRGDLVLFIGAGVSMSAGLVSWQGLLDALLSASAQAELIDATRLRRLDVRDQAAIIRDLYDGDASYRRAVGAAGAGAH